MRCLAKKEKKKTTILIKLFEILDFLQDYDTKQVYIIYN